MDITPIIFKAHVAYKSEDMETKCPIDVYFLHIYTIIPLQQRVFRNNCRQSLTFSVFIDISTGVT